MSSADVLQRVASTSVASPSTSSSAALRSRRALYGTDESVVLELGSSVWKFGFSGECQPRGCLAVRDFAAGQEEIWSLDKHALSEKESRIREHCIKRGLRAIYHEHFMIDPRTRKVILVDSPLLSNSVKETIVHILLDNLQVPSVSFASQPVCSALACGSSTGLVVDIGHLETVVVPVYHSRPLFTHVETTIKAGSRVTKRLRTLLLAHATYVPPPTSLNSTAIPQAVRLSEAVLTDELCEEIKTRCCFVGERISDYNVDDLDGELAILAKMEQHFARHGSSTTLLTFSIPNLSRPPVASGVGRGWIRIPGWLRERAAEVLFEDDFDERSVTDAILETLLKLPIDLRKPMAENVILTGGTASLPGLFDRLRSEIQYRLSISVPSPPPSPDGRRERSARHRALSQKLWTLRASPHFSPLVPLSNAIRFANARDATTLSWEPSLTAWVGASLAGSIKGTGIHEISKEQWQGTPAGVHNWPDLYWQHAVQQ